MLPFLVLSVILIIANGENSQSKNADIADFYLELERGDPVDVDIGQGNQVYCKLVDPNDHTVLDSFGRCRLTLDRVGYEHEGLWTMYIGYSGRVTIAKEILSITVNGGVPANMVKTNVRETSPGVKMSCHLPASFNLRGCQFRGPKGQVLLASSSGSHEESINSTRYKSELDVATCSVTIVDPKLADLGRWRCAVEAEDVMSPSASTVSSYFAFMEVFVHLQDGYDVSMNPKIEPRNPTFIEGLENEPVTLSCSINAEIKYCDFRNTNGTIIPVFPGMKTSSVEYVGSGFDAGECGIKMILPVIHDVQAWTCNIGLVENTKEYNAFFGIFVEEYLQVTQSKTNSRSIKVLGFAHKRDTIEYCRFVRSDGLTFTTENTPKPYNGSVSERICELTTSHVTTLDEQPWIVFAKLRNMYWEVNKQTLGLSLTEVTEPPNSSGNNSRPVFLYVILGVIMLSFIVTIALAPKKNRQWISSRAATVRQSMRLRKTPSADVESTLPTSATAPFQVPPYARLA